jgi:hypothetical protein
VENTRVVLFMAALPGLAGVISSISQSPAPWRRRFSTPYVRFSALGALDPASARTALLSQAGTEGGELEPEAVTALTGFALGHPMTLQMLGRSAWDAAASSAAPGEGTVVIRAPHAEQAIAQVSGELRTFHHKQDWKNCSDHERAVLRKLADLGGSAPERDLARAVKGAGPDPGAVISDLIDGGFLYDDPHTGVVSIVTPGFRQFIMSA